MKKLKKVVCGAILSASLLTSALPFVINPVCAADTKSQVDVYQQQKKIKSIVFIIGQDQYFINNDTHGVKMDAKPFIEDDRTFVPVRYLGYALGLAEKDIIWKNDIQQVIMRGPITSVEMTVGSKAIATMPTDKLINNTLEIVADKDLEIIDVAPVLKEDEGRTYLPARYVAEGLGYQIEWDAANGIVICYPKGDPKPDVSKVVEYVKQIKSGEVQPDQSQAQQPVTDSNSNGYTVPSKTNLHVDIPLASDNPNKVDISIAIRLQKPLEQQYKDAYNILVSKFGEKIAEEIVDYTKQKQKRFDDLPGKDWQANGQKIRVGSNKGNYWVNIIAWQPGV